MEWLEPLAVAFGTIALAELADKTQLVTISQACRYSYAPVLAGSALALICVSALGVLGGAALLLVLPQEWLAIVAGAMFIVFGAVMLYRHKRGERKGEGAGTAEREGMRAAAAEGECPPGDDGAAAAAAPTMSSWRVFGSTFGLVALAELGDKTQLSVIALTGEYANPWAVFIGASVGFVAVCTVGVLGGRMLAKRLGSGTLELVAAALFVILGAVFLAGAMLAL